MRMYEEDRFVYLHIINNNLFDWYKPTLDHFFEQLLSDYKEKSDAVEMTAIE